MKPDTAVFKGYHNQVLNYLKENFICKESFNNNYCRTYINTAEILFGIDSNMHERLKLSIDEMLSNIPRETTLKKNLFGLGRAYSLNEIIWTIDLSTIKLSIDQKTVNGINEYIKSSTEVSISFRYLDYSMKSLVESL
jgi:hypothetical protein